ncbi:MAG TPA: aldolase/citrate lyase family protein, partial [Alphaproteobacteria bacterium]|nr:aldolase/citrate lyase family protein [Alphaproteobacteria bacterium]
MVRPNRLKERLRLGHPSLGCWLHLASPIAAEVVAQAGYDAVVIDHEHGPGDLYNGILQMQAASGTAATTILRVPWNDPVYIKRALDVGVDGLVVPTVESAEQARAV